MSGYSPKGDVSPDQHYRNSPRPFDDGVDNNNINDDNINNDNNQPPVDKSTSTTLFVGNLPFNVRENDMEELFGKFGEIKHVKVGLDKFTGRSKGFGFVEFADRKDAEEAFSKYHSYDWMGRILRLDWDLGMERKKQIGFPERGRGGGGGSRRGFGRPMYSRGRRYSPYGGGGRGRSPRRYSRSPPRRRYSRSPPRRYHDRNDRGYDRYDRRSQYSPRRRSPSPRMSGSPRRDGGYPGDRRSPPPYNNRRYPGSPMSPRDNGRRGSPIQDMRQ